MSAPAASTWFQRFLLPGFAFKAVVIGGGYATGRELAEFFLPNGPWGGLLGMLLAALLWSLIAAGTFAFARSVGAHDYRAFFKALLGRGWIGFEVAYLLFVVVVLAVFGAAAGAIGAALFGAPPIAGTLLLALLIIAFATFGNTSVERLFEYVSYLLYAVYALFLVLALGAFGDRVASAFEAADLPNGAGWIVGGATYASYNVVGAVVILPVLRHLTSQRDAVIAGLVAGPLAMLPAILFFVCMVAFYPAIGRAALPADVLLAQLRLPLFHLLFQLMIFAALLESGTGCVHAVNERLSAAWAARRGVALGRPARALLTALLLVGCMLVAERFGLVALIAQGYRLLAYLILAIYVLPLVIVGIVRLARGQLLPENGR